MPLPVRAEQAGQLFYQGLSILELFPGVPFSRLKVARQIGTAVPELTVGIASDIEGHANQPAVDRVLGVLGGSALKGKLVRYFVPECDYRGTVQRSHASIVVSSLVPCMGAAYAEVPPPHAGKRAYCFGAFVGQLGIPVGLVSAGLHEKICYIETSVGTEAERKQLEAVLGV